MNTLTAQLPQPLAHGRQLGQQLIFAHAYGLGERLGRHGHREDAPALEVALQGHAVVLVEQRGVLRAERRFDLLGAPHIVLALLALAVGVLGGVEPALGVAHLTQQVVERLLGYTAVEGLAGELVSVEVELRQQGVVVEHLLEVGDQPVGVGGVAMEPAADLVVDAAEGHRFQGLFRHLERLGLARAVVEAQQELQRHGLRELGCSAEAAVGGIVERGQASVRLSQQRLLQELRRCLGVGRVAEPRGECLGGLQHVTLPIVVGVGHGVQHAGEARHAVAVLGREVGAAVEGPAVRR